MFSNRKPKLMRVLAVVLAIMMVVINISSGAPVTALAVDSQTNAAQPQPQLSKNSPQTNEENSQNETNPGAENPNPPANGNQDDSATNPNPNPGQTIPNPDPTNPDPTPTPDPNPGNPTPDPGPAQYQVTVSKTGSGTVKINKKDYNGPISMMEKSKVDIEIIPDSNSVIESVDINGEARVLSNNERYTETIGSIEADTKINVKFQVKTYKITFNSNENGTITDDKNQTINSAGGTVSVKHGDASSFTVIPKTGFHVEQIKIDNNPIHLPDDVTQSTKTYTYTFNSVTKNYQVEVIFAINTYRVSAEVAGEHGSIDIDKTEVEHGGDVQVTMTPEDNSYRLQSLTINGQPKDDFTENNDGARITYSYTVTNITNDTNIEVAFESIQQQDGSWDKYVNIQPTKGTLIKSYKDQNGHEVRIYSKDAELAITPKEPYTKLDFSQSHRFLKEKVTVTQPVTINKLVMKEGGKRIKVNLPSPLILVFDTKSPSVPEPKLEGNNEAEVDQSKWFSDSVKVSGTIDNEQQYFDGITYATEIDKVFYSKSDAPAEEAKEAEWDADQSRYTFKLPEDEFKGKYKIWAADKAGNVSAAREININIDHTAPKLAEGKAVTFEQKNDSLWEQILNFLKFGTFFNKAVEVTVKAEDEASGMKSLILKANPLKKGDEPKQWTPDRIKQDGLTAEAIFTIDLDSFEGTFAVEAADNVNNKKTYDITSSNSNLDGDDNGVIMVERTAPNINLSISHPDSVTPYTNPEGKAFYSGDVAFDIKVQDDGSGVNTVKNSVNGKPYKTYDFSKEEAKQTSPAIESLRTKDLAHAGINRNPDGSYSVGVEAMDNAGNRSEAANTIYIDDSKPTLLEGKQAVTFETVNDGTMAKVLNFLSFGTFFNKKIEVTVKTEDNASGIKAIDLTTNNDKVVPELVDGSFHTDGLTAQAKFTIDVDKFEGAFTVKVTDNVNNKGTYLVTKDNSNIAADNSGIVMIEKQAPEAAINIKPDGKVQSNGGNQYNGDVTFEVTARDIDSGVNTVHFAVNGTEYNSYDYSTDKAKQTGPIRYKINTADLEKSENGKYNLSVYVVDNAGNTNQEEKTIYIDRTSPKITDFSFYTKGANGKYGKVAETADHKDDVQLTDYGFYFKKQTKVTVRAEDPKVDHEFTSKVKSLTVYLKDDENGKTYAVLAGGSVKSIDKATINRIAPIAATGEVSFYVPEAFKGQIFAKATDHVQNTGAFETPDGTVVENAKQHAKETHITFEKAKTSHKDNNGLELYSHNVNVKLTVADSYSGLGKIEWSVAAPYDTANNQSGKIIINNDKKYAHGSNTAGWKQTKTDHNLVTQMVKTFTVKNNSNNIVFNVKITDRAGNTSTEKIKFSIDKTAPTIQVTYDNNRADQVNKDFYKADRTATIVITERNFKPEDVVHKITNTDGVIPKLVGWSTAANSHDPDKTTHTATVKYTADGDYTFDINYKDNAGNAAAAFKQQKFTLDKTKPVIHVTYNNNAAAKGHYYKAARTATITIKEHNFDTSRLKITGTASDNGKKKAFPQVSGWRSNGDNRTATIHYAADGKYTFDIAYTDMAGNVADDFKKEEFIIDQTAPKLSITGVKDKSANNGDVIPVVSYSDTNFNQNAVSIKLKGANNGPQKLDGVYSKAANGQTFKFNNFAKTKKTDDIYTLSATVTDYAGNRTSETIQFSVNRYGSVYVFADSLKEIEGKYVQKEQDVIVTETNVDSLKKDSVKVKMTKNDTPTDLTEGKDYNVTHSGGKGQWSQYKYVIHKELFAGDGKYTIALYSEDAAGNVNENINEKKKAEISFGIDKTAPVIVPIDLEDGKQYPVDNKEVTVSVKDNLVLSGVTVYLNDKQVSLKNKGEDYQFAVPSLNSKQNVKITAVDAAGNEKVTDIRDILVSTNPIVRLYNNKPLFMGSIGGVGILGIGITGLVLFLKKKRKEAEAE